jgi:signal transduction histidine kinase
MKLLGAERRRERRLREELEAYARLDVSGSENSGSRSGSSGDIRDLGMRVCGTVAEVSAFPRAAMLAKDAEGRLFVAGNAGMDDLTVQALNGWGERAKGPRLSLNMGPERDGSVVGAGQRLGLRDPATVKPWTRSFALELRQEPVVKLARTAGLEQGCDEVWVAPLWTTGGRMIGAVVVCGPEGLGGAKDARRTAEEAVEEALSPIETLASKLARALENAALADRLLRSERLAGLGQLAGGVAHALNNPLAAVMGYAELIAETSDEERVKEDAAMILREAVRMRETVQNLVDLWRPATPIDEAVDMTALVRELTGACEEKLKARGVRLVVEAGENGAVVLGSKYRLQQVLEHLLNNAAQAVAAAPAAAGEKHLIRVTVRQDERGVQVIVSDSGTGFVEPARAFDPFYTGLRPGQGAGLGLGLSVCYGIVREHGGKISAFNLHPCGAAVVLELPAGSAVEPECVVHEQTQD